MKSCIACGARQRDYYLVPRISYCDGKITLQSMPRTGIDNTIAAMAEVGVNMII